MADSGTDSCRFSGPSRAVKAFGSVNYELGCSADPGRPRVVPPPLPYLPVLRALPPPAAAGPRPLGHVFVVLPPPSHAPRWLEGIAEAQQWQRAGFKSRTAPERNGLREGPVGGRGDQSERRGYPGGNANRFLFSFWTVQTWLSQLSLCGHCNQTSTTHSVGSPNRVSSRSEINRATRLGEPSYGLTQPACFFSGPARSRERERERERCGRTWEGA